MLCGRHIALISVKQIISANHASGMNQVRGTQPIGPFSFVDQAD